MSPDFKITAPKNNLTTHMKKVTIKGVSPYGTVTLFKDNTAYDTFTSSAKS